MWRDRRLLLVLGAGVVVAVAVAGFVALRDGGDPEAGPRRVDDPLGGFDRPRTVHLAPDGRLLVTDVGTGEDDGRVVAVDLGASTHEVLMDGLPSTKVSGGRFGDVAGASGAAMAPDGTVCVVIGAGPDGRGFNQLRCSDGLHVDLLAYERDNNPGGGALESNPFDVVYGGEGQGDWYLSDAAANVVLHVSRGGEVTVAGVFNEHIGLGGAEGEPTGLALADGRLSTALFGGGVITGGGGFSVPVFTRNTRPIAVLSQTPGFGQGAVLLSYADESLAEDTGSIRVGNSVMVDGLDRPTGFARLPDGRFVVAEAERGRLRIVEAG